MKKDNTLTKPIEGLNGNSLSLSQNQQIIPMELLTIKNIFKLFPDVKNKFNWSKEDLMDLFKEKLLKGKIDDDGELLISKESLEKLIEFRKNVD